MEQSDGQNLDALRRLLEEGEVLQDLIGISQERMEQRHGQARSLFEGEEYEEAAAIFTHLATLDPRCTHYWMGAAMSYIRLGQYDLALTVLTLLCVLEPDNPQPYYYSGLCLIRQGEVSEARQALELACETAQQDDVYRQIETDAAEQLARLEGSDG